MNNLIAILIRLILGLAGDPGLVVMDGNPNPGIIWEQPPPE